MHHYKIVTADNIQELREKIETFMTEGWQLAGGISVCLSQGSLTSKMFYQAITTTIK